MLLECEGGSELKDGVRRHDVLEGPVLHAAVCYQCGGQQGTVTGINTHCYLCRQNYRRRPVSATAADRERAEAGSGDPGHGGPWDHARCCHGHSDQYGTVSGAQHWDLGRFVQSITQQTWYPSFRSYQIHHLSI